MTSDSNKSIGIFDSGIGGLTVFKALEEGLPHEHLVYLGDTARVPYGNKSRETITKYSIENSHFLIQTGVKAIVVACNTASALALDELQKKFPIPIIGVIDPGVKAALSATQSGEVGIVGTESTISSSAYTKAIQKINPEIRTWGVACPLFVPLVEEGWVENEITELIAQKYLAPFFKTPIDSLILGCTHYPLLKKIISKIIGQKVKLVDSAAETAQAVKKLLKEKKLERTDSSDRSITFFVTDSPQRFKEVGKIFLQHSLEGVTSISL